MGRSERADDSVGDDGERAGVDRNERAKHAKAKPWLESDGEIPEKLETDSDEDEEQKEPPRLLSALGQLGIYLGLASLALTVLGLAGLSVQFQPYANMAITTALVGVTVSMILGVAFQAYVGDTFITRP